VAKTDSPGLVIVWFPLESVVRQRPHNIATLPTPAPSLAHIAPVLAVPPGLPSWVTKDYIEETIRVWQTASKTPLTQEGAIEIIMNMSRLLDVLLDKDAG
jgi:hypothetical protein